MGLRVALRNWLLKPGRAELAGDPCSVARAEALIWGHLKRGMDLAGEVQMVVHVEQGDDFAAIQPGELD